MTNSNAAGMLRRLKIPFIIFFSSMWVLFMCISVLQAADLDIIANTALESFYTGIGPAGSETSFVLITIKAAAMLVTILACMTVLIYGTITMTLQLSKTESGRRNVLLRVVTTASVIILALGVIGISYWAIRVCDISCRKQDLSIFYFRFVPIMLPPFLHHLIVPTALLLSFRVVVVQDTILSARPDAPVGASYSTESTASNEMVMDL